MSDEINKLVKKAQAGDKEAFAVLVTEIQDTIYNLSLRMLCDPEDAKDATQEIVIRVITKLSTFEFKSTFLTWVYRVATNYLLNTLKVIQKDPNLSFDEFQHDLESDLEDAGELEKSVEYPVLVNEVRIACTMAMLLCLDQKHRLAYILGEILELDHNEACEILEVSRDTFRKQLSRARSEVLAFTNKSCGLVTEHAKCRCDWKLKGVLKRGRVDQKHLVYAGESKVSYRDIKQKISETKGDLKTLSLQKAIPYFNNPENLGSVIDSLLANG